MSFLGSASNAYIKKDASGNTLFFPWGVLGSGYIIESEKDTSTLQLAITIMTVKGIVIGTALSHFFETWHAAVAFLIFLVVYYLGVKIGTKNLKKSPEKLRLTESYSKSLSVPFLIFFALASFIFVAIGFLMVQSEGDRLVGLAAIGMFGLSCVAFSYMIYSKFRKK